VPPLKLSKEQRKLLEEMIRIDQAGELGANWIYRGQHAVLGSDKKVGPLLQVIIGLAFLTLSPLLSQHRYTHFTVTIILIRNFFPSNVFIDSTCGIRRSTI
jgi:hypothetical protein